MSIPELEVRLKETKEILDEKIKKRIKLRHSSMKN